MGFLLARPCTIMLVSVLISCRGTRVKGLRNYSGDLALTSGEANGALDIEKQTREAILCFLKNAVGESFRLDPSLDGSPSCAVVSNSGALLSHDHGTDIDSHDVVVRFNGAPTKGFEAKVGSKVGIRYAGFTGHISNVAPGERVVAPTEEQEELRSAHPDATIEKIPGGPDEALERIQQAMQKMYPTRAGFHETNGGADPTSGFTGMLTALANCGSVDAYEMAPSDAAAASDYNYFENFGRATDNSWHGMFQAEHDLWSRLSSTDAETSKQTGKTSYPGFSSMTCPKSTSFPESVEDHPAMLQLLHVLRMSPE